MLKTITILLALLPFGYSVAQVYLLQAGIPHQLGADPGKELVHLQGEWAIRFLVLALLVNPLRRMTGRAELVKLRRMIGLFAFFYATLHMLAYAVFLLELDPAALWADVSKRPYITVGFTAWLLLVPLAATSTDAMMRRLGGSWKRLHRLIYVIGVLAVVHLTWLSKADYLDAIVYGLIIAFALVYRYLQGKTALFRSVLKTGA